MEVTVEQLAKAIETVVGARKYLPINKTESILVFERTRYIHVFRGLESRFGSPDPVSAAKYILKFREEQKFEYHPELLELINGL